MRLIPAVHLHQPSQTYQDHNPRHCGDDANSMKHWKYWYESIDANHPQVWTSKAWGSCVEYSATCSKSRFWIWPNPRIWCWIDRRLIHWCTLWNRAVKSNAVDLQLLWRGCCFWTHSLLKVVSSVWFGSSRCLHEDWWQRPLVGEKEKTDCIKIQLYHWQVRKKKERAHLHWSITSSSIFLLKLPLSNTAVSAVMTW